MSSSIEEEFQPPEWATKEEVIKAACHYINYWKIEARSRNQQWLDALQGESNAKRCETSLRGELNRKHQELAILRSAREQDVAEIHRLKAEVERLRASSFVTAVPVEQYERLIKAGDGLHAFLINYIVDNRISSAYLNKLDDGWQAAKEGKPSV